MRTIIILILSFQYLSAQLPYNHRVENDQIQALGHLVYELDNSYLGIGRGIDTIDYRRGIYATEFDKVTGEVINTEKITYPNSLLFFDQLNTVIEYNNKPHFLFSRSDTIYLTSYDDLDNTLNIEKKIFSSDPVNSLFIYDFKYDNGNFYILSDHTSIATGISQSELFIYNIENDSITEIYLDDPESRMYTPNLITLDTVNFLLVYDVSDNVASHVKISQFNMLGDIMWSYDHIDSNGEGNIYDVYKINDKNLILGGRKFVNSSDGNRVPIIFKFNISERRVINKSNFNIPQSEWNTRHYPVSKITSTHNKAGFICASQLFKITEDPDTIVGSGFLSKVDTNLNVIWKRQYTVIDLNYVEHEISMMIPTSDGNYLGYGSSYNGSAFPGEVPLLSWAIKIDEDGKIVGDTTTSILDWQYEDLSDQIEIFPNPASHYIYVNQNEIEDITYQVYDESGRLEDEFKIRSKNSSVMKDISNWNKGMKFINIMQDNEKVGQVKIIKY